MKLFILLMGISTGVCAYTPYEYSNFVSWQGSLGYYDTDTTVMERPIYQAGQPVYVSRPMYRQQVQIYESAPLYVTPTEGVNIQLPPINVRW